MAATRTAERLALRFACDRCHGQKLKCRPSETSGGTCERCLRASLPCTHSQRSRMQKRLKSNAQRQTQSEVATSVAREPSPVTNAPLRASSQSVFSENVSSTTQTFGEPSKEVFASPIINPSLDTMLDMYNDLEMSTILGDDTLLRKDWDHQMLNVDLSEFWTNEMNFQLLTAFDGDCSELDLSSSSASSGERAATPVDEYNTETYSAVQDVALHEMNLLPLIVSSGEKTTTLVEEEAIDICLAGRHFSTHEDMLGDPDASLQPWTTNLDAPLDQIPPRRAFTATPGPSPVRSHSSAPTDRVNEVIHGCSRSLATMMTELQTILDGLPDPSSLIKSSAESGNSLTASLGKASASTTTQTQKLLAEIRRVESHLQDVDQARRNSQSADHDAARSRQAPSSPLLARSLIHSPTRPPARRALSAPKITGHVNDTNPYYQNQPYPITNSPAATTATLLITACAIFVLRIQMNLFSSLSSVLEFRDVPHSHAPDPVRVDAGLDRYVISFRINALLQAQINVLAQMDELLGLSTDEPADFEVGACKSLRPSRTHIVFGHQLNEVRATFRGAMGAANRVKRVLRRTIGL